MSKPDHQAAMFVSRLECTDYFVVATLVTSKGFINPSKLQDEVQGCLFYSQHGQGGKMCHIIGALNLCHSTYHIAARVIYLTMHGRLKHVVAVEAALRSRSAASKAIQLSVIGGYRGKSRGITVRGAFDPLRIGLSNSTSTPGKDSHKKWVTHSSLSIRQVGGATFIILRPYPAAETEGGRPILHR